MMTVTLINCDDLEFVYVYAIFQCRTEKNFIFFIVFIRRNEQLITVSLVCDRIFALLNMYYKYLPRMLSFIALNRFESNLSCMQHFNETPRLCRLCALCRLLTVSPFKLCFFCVEGEMPSLHHLRALTLDI